MVAIGRLQQRVPYMSDAFSVCPKCQGAMQQGYVPELAGGTGLNGWVKGAPKKNWVGGVNVPGILIPIATFRCESCGYLESYARKEFAAKEK
jgi:hypothetical protein